MLGTTSVAVDVSERKANEDQLRLLLRELTHRSKNLLAVIHAIARQTASRTRSVEDFLDRFSARLCAIGCSHDLLIADNWQGASLRMLVEHLILSHHGTYEFGSPKLPMTAEDYLRQVSFELRDHLRLFGPRSDH